MKFTSTSRKKVARFFQGLFLVCFPFVTHAQPVTLFGITNVWRFNQTENLDAVAWKNPAFDDSTWPSGAALLYSETNALVAPRNTPLTLGRTTYYFRTHFTFTNMGNDLFLTFSNKVDDGAVFFLNGAEVQRLRMSAAPASITYTNFATAAPSSGDATDWDVFSIPATNAISGDNVIAVEVHQVSASSSDIVFGSSLSVAAGSIIRGPYLQMGSSTNITVRWRSDVPMDSVVRFGTSSSNLNFSTTDVAVMTEHEITLRNLIPDTKYFYSVGNSINALAGGDTNHWFVTSPIPGTPKPTRLWVIGDAGTGGASQTAVRDAYYNFAGSRPTDLWLMLGDNAYNTGTDAEYQTAVFTMYKALLRQSVLWSTLGNHETAQSTAYTNTYPYFQLFTFPTSGEAGGIASGTEHYYSFDHANIHFICLDSMTANRATNGAMANWLRTDLASTTNFWTIAFWHHPPYTKGSHDSDTEIELKEMRENFLPILEDAGVDLVLSGHSHCYERSFFLNGHYGLSTTLTSNMIFNANSGRETNAAGPYTKWASGSQSHQGAVYVVAGSSGQATGGALNHPAMFISLSQLGSLVLDVNGDRLEAKFLRETGAIDDQFTIVKRDVEFSSIQPVANGVQLLATNVAASKTNIIQTSDTFLNWVSISTNVSSSNRFQFLDTQATNSALNFYRILRLP
ncbi:MAG: metallophosphoesterase family protein [Verrucomicrobiota bacterium]